MFVDIYNNFSDDNKPPVLSEAPPPTTQFVEKTEDIDRSTLYSFDGPFQLLQADVAYTSFLATSAGDPKFCLLFVDLFTSKTYTCPIKNKNLLAKKMEILYNDIQNLKKGKIRLQTDQEFKQRKIYELNKRFDVEMFSTNIRGGKAFAAKQNIREF